MNLTVLENRLADFNNTMKSIADNLQYFRGIVEKEMADKEARKGEVDEREKKYEKRELARNLIVRKGDSFFVNDDFNIPSTESSVANTVKAYETLVVEKVDCLINKYDVEVTVFRPGCGISNVLTLDQIRKLVENDLIEVIKK